MAGRFAPAPILALTAWALMGCYVYVPVTQSPMTGDGRIVLTSAGSTALQPQLGTGVREIDGTILRMSADSIVITVAQTTTDTRERFVQSGLTVAVARPYVQQVAARTLSRKRSVGLAATVLAVISIALGATSGVGGSASGDGSGGAIQP